MGKFYIKTEENLKRFEEMIELIKKFPMKLQKPIENQNYGSEKLNCK